MVRKYASRVGVTSLLVFHAYDYKVVLSCVYIILCIYNIVCIYI